MISTNYAVSDDLNSILETYIELQYHGMCNVPADLNKETYIELQYHGMCNVPVDLNTCNML